MMLKINPGTWKPEEIRELRKRFQMSLAHFAALTGLTASRVNEWERGKRQPSVLTRWALDAIAKRLESEYKHL